MKRTQMNPFTEIPRRLQRITTSGAYKAEIDGLRFWAILPVILWHGIQRVARAQPDLSSIERSAMLWVPEARVGVLLFFVISGFIISSQFIRNREIGRPLDLKSYFYRRVTRIEPPYLLLLLATYLLFSLTSFRPANAVAFWRGPESLEISFFASIVYLHGLIFNEMPRLFPGGWSLEVEVQFYILAPAMFALLYKAPSIRSRLVVGGMVLLATFAIDVIFEHMLGPTGPHRYTLIRYFFYFWLGALLAEVNAGKRWPRLPAAVWDCTSFGSLLIYLLSGVAEHSNWPAPQGGFDAVRLVCFFFIFGGAMNGKAFKRMSSMAWIALIGGACYSIYLSHVAVLQIAAPLVFDTFHPSSLLAASALALAIELPLVLIVGLLVYTFVERPFMIPHWPQKVAAWIKSSIPLSRSAR